LVIVSPGLQPFWLLSGRNSTYPAVQISRASSVDAASGHSFLHLFAADGIADGPIAWVELPMALPVGLHANVLIHPV
jgi:hypothetical protein